MSISSRLVVLNKHAFTVVLFGILSDWIKGVFCHKFYLSLVSVLESLAFDKGKYFSLQNFICWEEGETGGHCIRECPSVV